MSLSKRKMKSLHTWRRYDYLCAGKRTAMDSYEQFLSVSKRLQSARRVLIDHVTKFPPDDPNRIRLMTLVAELQEEWWCTLERPAGGPL